MQPLLSHVPALGTEELAHAATYSSVLPKNGMATPVRILILDPDEYAVRDLIRAFTERGWDVVQCPTFLEALRLLEGPPFDLVLIEMTLPDILGTDAWAFIQKLQPNAAGIITTASISLHRAINATGAGAHAYLLKPLDTTQLCQLIEHLLERQRVRNHTARIQKRMVAFANLLSAISHATKAEQILDKTLAHLRSILHFDVALIYVLRREQSGWIYQRTPSISHFSKELRPGQIELLVDWAKQAVALLQPIAVTNATSALATEKNKLEEQDMATCAVVPLIGQNIVHGALVVVNKLDAESQLEPLDVDTLLALCHATAIALDRAQLSQTLSLLQRVPQTQEQIGEDDLVKGV
jgi:DNA-binding response OmpR family regulator